MPTPEAPDAALPPPDDDYYRDGTGGSLLNHLVNVRNRRAPKRANGNGEHDDPWAASPGGSPDEPLLEVPVAHPRQPLNWPALEPLEPPVRQWAINGWIGLGHVTLLVGVGGIGKSLLAQQLASAIALGRHFIDQIPQPRRVLYWACEDDHDEIWRRQIAISISMKARLSAFAPSLIMEPRHGLSNTMVSTEFGRPLLTNLIDELAAQANDYATEVVIIDNAAQVYGANENERHAVTMFLNALAGRMPGKAIILLAHPSRAQGSEFSGSSAWENTARTRLYLGANLPGEKPDSDDDRDTVRYLSRRKANYSAKDYRKFNYADGVLHEVIPEPDTGIVGYAKTQGAETIVLNALARLSDMMLRATEGSRSPEYLPRLMAEYKLLAGISKAEAGTAMRSLMLQGRIVRYEAGKYGSNRTPKWGLKEAGKEAENDPV